jgi:NADH-quinone oxidoreductase subunit H
MMIKVLLILGVSVFAMSVGLLYRGVDRILTARMQGRVGPPVTQPFRDVKKLLVKERIVPEHAVKWLFNLVPVLALVSVIAIMPYVPMGMDPILGGHGDLILVLYLLTFPSLALAVGGFASSSPYAAVGGQREIVKMIGYEFPLAIAIVSVAWLLSSSGIGNAFSLAVISGNPVWSLAGPVGWAGLSMILLSLLFVIPGELGRVPFDVSEADSEIAGGVLVEYSGRNLALFYIADAVKAIAFASVVIALFLPYGISGAFSLSGPAALAADFAFYLAKLLCVVFIGLTLVGAATGRLRISQVVSVYWKYPTMASLAGLLLIAADMVI